MHLEKLEGQSQAGATVGIGYDMLRLWGRYFDTEQKVSLDLGETEDKGWKGKAESAGSGGRVCEGP